MIRLPLLQTDLKTRSVAGATQVYDPVRRRWVALTPEEHVRQLLLAHLLGPMGYPSSLIAVERGLPFGHTTLRFDMVIYHRDTHQPWMLVECKAPAEPVTDAVLHQLLQYHSKLPGCRYWLVSNGHQTYCADALQKDNVQWLAGLPPY